MNGFALRVECNDEDGVPVAGSLGPTLGVLRLGGRVDGAALGELRGVLTEVAGVGGDKADGAVEVLGVVPADEAVDPLLGGGQVDEGAPGGTRGGT